MPLRFVDEEKGELFALVTGALMLGISSGSLVPRGSRSWKLAMCSAVSGEEERDWLLL